jgi:hypothetical protein
LLPQSQYDDFKIAFLLTHDYERGAYNGEFLLLNKEFLFLSFVMLTALYIGIGALALGVGGKGFLREGCGVSLLTCVYLFGWGPRGSEGIKRDALGTLTQVT